MGEMFVCVHDNDDDDDENVRICFVFVYKCCFETETMVDLEKTRITKKKNSIIIIIVM